MNKKNEPKSLFLIVLTAASLLFLGLTYSSEPPPERAEIPFPLFGHFYPEISTNISFSMPNLRYGSGIR